MFLDIFDYLALMVFILEILLKWIDGFFEFWKNGWNVFDFFVTVLVRFTFCRLGVLFSFIFSKF